MKLKSQIAEIRRKKVSEKLLALFTVLSRANALPFIKNDNVLILGAGRLLLKIARGTIQTPVTEITDSVFTDVSPLPDEFVSMESFATFVNQLQSKATGLDHVGFCYTVASQEEELVRIKKQVAASSFHLYEMTSTDLAKWYFVGDRSNWKDPLIELLPVVPNVDSTLAYWLPHVQIDINTQWTAIELEEMVRATMGSSLYTERRIDPTYGVYSVRVTLGRILGVNIHLDISTNVKNVKWVREHMLKEIHI